MRRILYGIMNVMQLIDRYEFKSDTVNVQHLHTGSVNSKRHEQYFIRQ